MRRPDGSSVAVILVIVVFAVISGRALKTQRPERLYADAQKYQSMSVQFLESRRPVVEQGPFVYRIGVPWMASVLRPPVERAFPAWHRQIDEQVGMFGIAPFFAINAAAAFVGSVLLLLYVKRFVPGTLVPVVLVAAWMATWHAPVRFVYFYPVNVDSVFFVCLLGALIVVEMTRHRPALHAAAWLVPVVFAGTLVRESMVLAAVVFAVARMVPRSDRVPGDRTWAIVLPFVAWAGAAALARQIALAEPTYHPVAEMIGVAREKPLFTWVLAWFFTFGPPAIVFLVAGFGEVLALLRARPELGALVATCGVLGFFGGTDTERILAWSAPAVYVLVGRAIGARRQVLARMPVVVAALVLVQVASSRALWPIPVGIDHAARFSNLGANWGSVKAIADKFLVIDNYYANLWSFFGSRAVHAVTLGFDLMMTAAFALSIERARRYGACQ